MGTRAIITKNGKPFIATHWDGYPDVLGADLLGKTKDEDIVRVAMKRDIDFADSKLLKKLNQPNVDDIKYYGDFAEWQYDLKNGRWFVRPLSGKYPESLNTSKKLKPLEFVIEGIVERKGSGTPFGKILLQRVAMEKRRVGAINVKSHLRKTRRGKVPVKGYIRRG